MSHPLATLLDQLRNVFAKETLPPPPDGVTRRSGVEFAKLIFSREPLPFEPERPRRRRSNALTLLFLPEPLPLDPERPPARQHTHWLAWLFLPEKIDRSSDSPEVH